MPDSSDEFYRIQKLPPYVFAVINEMRAKARAAQIDASISAWESRWCYAARDVNKLVEAARNARNHRYRSRAIPKFAKGLPPATSRIMAWRSIPI
jgi:alanine-synthesizing transaminase